MIQFGQTPGEASRSLADRAKTLRLLKKWKRSTLAKRSGVTDASLKRFEQTGKVSLENLLKIMHALGRIQEIDLLLNPPEVRSLNDLRARERKIPKRGLI